MSETEDNTSLETIEKVNKELRDANINTIDAQQLNFLTSREDFTYTQFRGTDLDVLFGFIYLFQKHKNGCMPLKIQIRPHEQLYFNIGINWLCHKGVRKLLIPPEIPKNFRKCKKKEGVEFIFILLTFAHLYNCKLRNNKNEYHANILIYNKSDNTIERFEPHGCIVESDQWYEAKEFDKAFAKISNKLFDANYKPACLSCPYIGFQGLQETEELKKYGDPGGFCAAWTLIIIDLRLKNPKESLKELQLKALKRMTKNIKPLTTLVRTFSQFVVKKRKEMMMKLSERTRKNIEMNSDNLELLSKKDLEQINKFLLKEFKKLKQII
jgi:hypothetical protein